jgi:hypothetical protein
MSTEGTIISVPEAVAGSRVDSHQFLDGLALAYHRAVAVRLRAAPEAVVRTARENLARWLESDTFDPGTAAALREWLSILDGSTPEELLALITAETDEGQRLRQSSPFVGVLTDEERLEIMDACERAAA